MSPVNAGGVPAKLCWATGAALPVRVEGSNLVADPGSLPAGEQVCAFDGPFRLGSGEVGADGSLALSLGYAPGGPVAVLESASPVPAAWMPYSWERLASGPAGRFRPGLAYAGGKVHVFGGSAYGALPADQVWAVYDLGAGTWFYPSSQGGPSQRYAHVMVSSSEGEIWIFAGRELVGSYPYPLVGDLWRWREGAGWERVAVPGPPARGWSQGVWLGNGLWVFGGLGSSGTLGDLWVWDPGSCMWQRKQPGPPARCMHAVAACGSRLYVHGGSLTQVPSSSTVLRDLWEYDPATGSWRQRASGPALYDHTMVGIGGLLYVYGGCDPAGRISGDVWVYDPARDAWTRLDVSGTWPAGRYAQAMCAGPDGSVYVFGASQTDVWQEFWRLRLEFTAPEKFRR